MNERARDREGRREEHTHRNCVRGCAVKLKQSKGPTENRTVVGTYLRVPVCVCMYVSVCVCVHAGPVLAKLMPTSVSPAPTTPQSH